MAATVAGIIFSNLHDNNIPELTRLRTMASVPFGCRYRLIDFALSNMVNAGITDVNVKMNGGTSGPKEIYQHLAAAGIGTVVGMHFPESHLEEARKHHINMVISGHMSSDSLGINLIADEWEKKGVEVVPCSGLIRVSRV